MEVSRACNGSGRKHHKKSQKSLKNVSRKFCWYGTCSWQVTYVPRRACKCIEVSQKSLKKVSAWHGSGKLVTKKSQKSLKNAMEVWEKSQKSLKKSQTSLKTVKSFEKVSNKSQKTNKYQKSLKHDLWFKRSSSNTISICKRIRPGSNLATRVKVDLEQFYYCGSIGDTPGSPKGRRHRKMAAPVPFMTRRSAFFAFFIAKSRALRPLRANDGTPGEKKRVCALQKNVETWATWGSWSPIAPT